MASHFIIGNSGGDASDVEVCGRVVRIVSAETSVTAGRNLVEGVRKCQPFWGSMFAYQGNVQEDKRTKVPLAVKLGCEGRKIHGLTAKGERVCGRAFVVVLGDLADPVDTIGLGVVEKQDIPLGRTKTTTPRQT